jgi:competence protein ComFA
MGFICSRCQNQTLAKIGIKNGLAYCRACIEFIDVPWTPISKTPKVINLVIPYPLTNAQLMISHQLLRCYQKQQSVMIDAVTGSGKTELVYHLMQRVISEGKNVGFVIPRTDVVREMVPRFQQIFPTLMITSVLGGHHDQLEGDIVILTTHQIFRYQHYFDVLVFDEVDAFPYRDNQVLKAFVDRSVRGMIVYLSATFTQGTLKEFKLSGGQVFHLYQRYHGYPLPLINYAIHPFLLKWLTILPLLASFQKQQIPTFIFVPTIRLGKTLFWWLKLYFPMIRFAYASSPTRQQDVEAFKAKKYTILITTTILERGITLPHLQVILFSCDHPLMNAAMLIQMAGRVGRKSISPEGKVIALVNKITPNMLEANEKMKFANDHL